MFGIRFVARAATSAMQLHVCVPGGANDACSVQALVDGSGNSV